MPTIKAISCQVHLGFCMGYIASLSTVEKLLERAADRAVGISHSVVVAIAAVVVAVWRC